MPKKRSPGPSTNPHTTTCDRVRHSVVAVPPSDPPFSAVLGVPPPSPPQAARLTASAIAIAVRMAVTLLGWSVVSQDPAMTDAELETLTSWLVGRGLDGASETELLDGVCAGCRRIGVPVTRAMALVDTLHPIYEGRIF